MKVCGDAESRLRVGKRDGESFAVTEALVGFEEGDKFAEDGGGVAAVDFIDDEDVGVGGRTYALLNAEDIISVVFTNGKLALLGDE